MRFSQRFPALFLIGLLAACANSPQTPDPSVDGEPFSMQSLAKTDIDLVGETHQKMLFSDLRVLAEKLYKRNPKEWKKSAHHSLDEALNALFTEPYPEPEGKHGTDCIRLAFEENYQGDRVAAFIAGLATMVMDSYGNKHDYYILDLLDAQMLYNSARNIEVAAWMLRSKLDAKGQPFLQSSTQGNEVNLSFERIFGRLIANQETIAQITADRTHRVIKTTLQTVIMAFIPL